VYSGFAMLITGVFLLFYVPHQRVWALIKSKGNGAEIVIAGTRTRHQHDFNRYFLQISHTIKQMFPAA